MSKLHIPLIVFAVVITFGLAVSLQGVLGITITSDLNFGSGKKITGLPVPVGNSEAANKEYIDSQVNAIAVGSGASYTGYGTTSCATGWTSAYTGVAMSWATPMNAVAAGGGIVCKQGIEFTSANFIGSFWFTGGGGKNSDSFVSCVVCVK